MEGLPSDLLPAVLQAVADGIVVWDADGRMLFANDTAARMNGYASAEDFVRAPRGEVLSRFAILDEDGMPVQFPSLPGRRALQGDGPSEAVVHYREKESSEERWSLVAARPITSEDGTLRAVVSSFRD